MASVAESITSVVRSIMRTIARGINKTSGGKINPNSITIVGLLAHIGIAFLIAADQLVLAGILLIVFGLFDTLDGELARLQNKASASGMVLDSSTDRMKEVILYMAIAYYFVNNLHAGFAVWAVAACGFSVLVSFVKAKGETALNDAHLTANEKNRVFSGGIFSFEVRMLVIVFGLLSNRLDLAVVVVAVGASLTMLGRLYSITKSLYVKS